MRLPIHVRLHRRLAGEALLLRCAGPVGLSLTALSVLALGGCASADHRAPVEDLSALTQPLPSVPGAPASPAQGAPAAPSGGQAAVAAAGAPVAGADVIRPAAGSENAGKPGFYSVKPGDTLIRIGLETGQNWRDVARWNGIDNPNLIEVGQVLRVAPPAAEAVAAARPVAPPARSESRPLSASGTPAPAPAVSLPSPSTAQAVGTGGAPTAAPAGTSPATAGAAASQAAAAGPVQAVPAAPAAPATPAEGDEGVGWAWPAAGAVVVPFEQSKNKGLAIAGKAGDPVLAAADGRVVYAGSGLRGYGNLVIVKHNNLYLSAYAHNQVLLVKEDQNVKRGQKIAEMGSTDAERVQLHFEIRRQGKPVDPARLLPTR